MDSGIVSGLFSRFFIVLLLGIVAVAALIILGINYVINYSSEKTYESKTLLAPEVLIKTENRDGVVKSDTTYVYHLE